MISKYDVVNYAIIIGVIATVVYIVIEKTGIKKLLKSKK